MKDLEILPSKRKRFCNNQEDTVKVWAFDLYTLKGPVLMPVLMEKDIFSLVIDCFAR